MRVKSWVAAILLALSLAAPVSLRAATVEDYYREANQFYLQKEYSHALDVYQSAISSDPSPYRAYTGIGNCQYFMGQKESALESYKRSLALKPDDALTQFVEKLKTELAAKGGPFYKGRLFFERKQYKEAVPFLQEAIEDEPKNYQAYYDLGYSQYMLGDRPEAALNFAYYGKKFPDASAAAFAEKIKGGLSTDDQEWMEDQLKNGPPFTPPFRYSGIGVRLEPHLAMASLKDFKDFAASLQTNPGVKATAPGGAFAVEVNPFAQVSENVEAGLTLGYVFVSEFSAEYKSSTASGNGIIDYQVIDAGLSLRAHFLKLMKGKIGFFAEANPCFFSAGLHVANSDPTLTAWNFVNKTGDFSGSGFGGKIKIGADWKPVPSSLISLFAGYQFANISGFKGQGGEIQVQKDASGTSLLYVPDGSTPAVPAGASLSPLTLDLTGVLVGIDLTVLL